MRPLRLVLSGFRSFRAEQALDFAELGLFAIVGDTGAGKSSILEAIVYALYNKSTFSERDVKQLIALDADTMHVAFDFEISAIRYRVTRSASRVTGRPALHALRCLDEAHYRFDGETGVNAEILRLSGLEYDTFIKTVVLPQGRFADLLTAKHAERLHVLGELLGLDEIDRIRETLEHPYQQSRDLCVAFRSKLETLGHDPAGRAAALGNELALVSSEVVRLDAVRAQVASAIDRARQLKKQRTTWVSELSGIDAALLHARRLETLDESAKELRVGLAGARRRHEAALRECGAAKDGNAELAEACLDAVSLARVRLILAQFSRQELRALDTALAIEEKNLRTRELDFDRQRAARALAAAQKTEADAGYAEASTSAESASLRESAGRATCATLFAARSRVDDALGLFEKAQSEEIAVRLNRDEAMTTAQEVDRATADARAAFERERIADLAATVAHDISAGSPCPVCRQIVPEGFVALPGGDLKFAQKRSERADKERAAVHADVARKVERVARSEREVEDTRAAWSAAVRSREAVGVAAQESGVSVAAAGEAAALAELVALRLAAYEARDERRRAVDVLARNLAGADATLIALESALSSDRARHVGDGERVKTLGAEMERDRLSLPSLLRPANALSDADLKGCAARLDDCDVAARARAERLTKAETELLCALGVVHEGEQRWTAEVESVVAAALAGADQTLRSIAESGIGVREAPPARFSDDAADAIGWGASLRAWGDRGRKQAEAAEENTGAALRSVEERLAVILDETGVADAQALDLRVAQIRTQAAVLGHQLETAVELLRTAREIEARLAVVDPLARALEHLRRYLESNKFKEYLMRLRERRLLGVATEILRKMTGDRYAFAEGFAILDAQTQRTRAPQTLSGGEKFVASLALALGLVELTSRAGGRLDALFLDEGFGSLDASFLDVALAELSDRASSGKMIGVITHVRGIAAEIGTVLRVQRLAGGSVVSRLSDDDRERFIDDGLTSGLLDAAT